MRLPLDDREAMRELVRLRKEHQERIIIAGLQEEFEAECIAMAQAIKPKAKLDYAKAKKILGDSTAPVFERYKARADAYSESWQAEKKRLEELLHDTATRVAVSKGTEWLLVTTVYGASYASCGSQYAKGMADMHVWEIGRHDIAARVRGDGFPVTHTWIIEAQVAEELDVEILKRKPGPPVRDALKWCWGHGLNPRVFNPYLPAGLEEKLGLDYFGGDKK